MNEGTVLVSSGPLHMTIFAKKKDRYLNDEAEEGARYALHLLRQLSCSLSLIKQKSIRLTSRRGLPEVVNEMILATQAMEDPSLTPLAAVAGATADLVADFLLHRGATKVVANNGGDIAIRVREGESARVGLCLDISKHEVNSYVAVTQDCGICTSGFGGRSFTLGIADSVVILSDRASVADAAATRVGNKTTLLSPKILREKAKLIYPDTDIPEEKITVSVGDLTGLEIKKALRNGTAEALNLIKKELIWGAVLAVKGNRIDVGYFESNSRNIEPRTGNKRNGETK
jgi:ApbE superfamily uncharacterized protein (UPF0280 family)